MRISMLLDYAADPLGTIDAAVRAEEAGVDMVWVAEAYGFDAVSILGALSQRTERMALASGVLQLGSRTPALLAMTAAGLDAVSGGRFTLGLGTSGPQVIEGFHGLSFDRPILRTRETVEVVRTVLRREPLAYDGETIKVPRPGSPALRLLTKPIRSSIPIAIAALGPQNVALTAEIADIWLPMFGFFDPARWRDVWGGAIDRGLAARDPELPPLETAAGAYVAFDDDAEAGREAARQLVTLYAGGMGSREKNFYNQLLRRYGYEAEARTIQDSFLDKRRDEAAAAVPEEFLAATSLCGDEATVRAQVARYRDAGVTNLFVRAIGTDPAATLSRLRRIVDQVTAEA